MVQSSSAWRSDDWGCSCHDDLMDGSMARAGNAWNGRIMRIGYSDGVLVDHGKSIFIAVNQY